MKADAKLTEKGKDRETIVEAAIKLEAKSGDHKNSEALAEELKEAIDVEADEKTECECNNPVESASKEDVVAEGDIAATDPAGLADGAEPDGGKGDNPLSESGLG